MGSDRSGRCYGYPPNWVRELMTHTTCSDFILSSANSQIILLPGNDWTSAQEFVTDGSGPALLGVVNPDGSTTNLIFDVHKYLDSDNS